LAGLSSTASSSTGASDLSFFFASTSSSLSAARVRLDLGLDAGLAELDAGAVLVFVRDLVALGEGGLLSAVVAVDFFLGDMIERKVSDTIQRFIYRRAGLPLLEKHVTLSQTITCETLTLHWTT
jgi:hypothetical protein